MRFSEEGMLLRIFIGENDKFEGKPLYEKILEKAQALSLGGATVFHGVMGFGAHSKMHTSKVLRLTDDLPVVIEIVDSEEQLNLILPFLNEVVGEGLLTMEKVSIVKYRKKQGQ